MILRVSIDSNRRNPMFLPSIHRCRLRIDRIGRNRLKEESSPVNPCARLFSLCHLFFDFMIDVEKNQASLLEKEFLNWSHRFSLVKLLSNQGHDRWWSYPCGFMISARCYSSVYSISVHVLFSRSLIHGMNLIRIGGLHEIELWTVRQIREPKKYTLAIRALIENTLFDKVLHFNEHERPTVDRRLFEFACRYSPLHRRLDIPEAKHFLNA